MGWCQSFGPQITAGCERPMVAAQASCGCQDCGATCTGRFRGCPAVWAAGPQPSLAIDAPVGSGAHQARSHSALDLLESLQDRLDPSLVVRGPDRSIDAPATLERMVAALEGRGRVERRRAASPPDSGGGARPGSTGRSAGANGSRPSPAKGRRTDRPGDPGVSEPGGS